MDPINYPVHKNPPPLIRVKGSHREIGRQIGEACANVVCHSLENARALIRDSYGTLELNWEGAQIQASKYIPFAHEYYPQYVDEIVGIAEGANVPFADLAVLIAMEAVAMDALHLTKCTSMAVNSEVTADGHVLVAHNEDWLPEDESDVYLLHVTSDDEPPFLAMTYGGLLPNIGFNEAGIAQCCDSVRPKDSRIGIPRAIVSRAVLGAPNVEEAIKHALVPHRAAGYNHLLVDESGELYNVEVSARKFAILYGENNYLVHTNHYLDGNMKNVEADVDEEIDSVIRYFRADRLLKQSNQHTVKTLQTIQKDHFNLPNAICDHAKEGSNPLNRKKTINAMIIDLTARMMHFVWGNPCSNPYHTFYL